MATRNKAFTTNSAVIALAIFAAIPVAYGADMDPIYVEEPVTTPVEFGSGWYLRGDLGYSSHGPFDTSGTSGDNLDVYPVNASVAVGYTFSDHLRGEVEFGYLGSSSFDDTGPSICDGTSTFTPIVGPVVSGPATIACEGRDHGDNEMWNGLVNGYVDLGNYGGFTPYIGGGIGLALSSYSGAGDDRECEDSTTSDATGTTVFTCDSDQEGETIDDSRLGFLWSVAAGFGYQITENTTVDVGYRYLSSPNATQLVNLPDGIGEEEGMSVHQIRVGLRYAIW